MRTAFNYLMFFIAACMVGVMLFPPPPNKRADYCEPAEAVAVEIGDLHLRIPFALEPSVQIGDKPRYFGTTESCVKQGENYCCKMISLPIRSTGVFVRVQYGERANYDKTNVLIKFLNAPPDKVRFMQNGPWDQDGPPLFGNPTKISRASPNNVYGTWEGLRIIFSIGLAPKIDDPENESVIKIYKRVEETLESLRLPAPR